MGGDPVAGELLVRDQQAAALGDDGLGVQPLLAVAHGQRHVHRGDAQRGELADGARAGPADHQVGDREGLLHLAQVLAHVVPLGAGDAAHGGPHLLGLAGAGQVQHLHAGGEDRARLRGHGPVHGQGAQRPAGHEQRDPLRVEAELGGRPAAGGPGVLRAVGEQPDDLGPQRQAGDLGARQPGAGERHGDGGGTAGAEAVGQARAGVLLVHDDRHAAGPGREVGGGRDVAAEPDHGRGADLVDRGARGVHRLPQQPRQPEPVRRGAAGQRHLRHHVHVEAALRHQPGLQALGGAQHGEAQLRVAGAQLLGDGEQRVHVAGGPAAGQQHGARPGRVLRHRGLRGRPRQGVVGVGCGHGVLRFSGAVAPVVRVRRVVRGRRAERVTHGPARSRRASGARRSAGRPAPRRHRVRCARRR